MGCSQSKQAAVSTEPATTLPEETQVEKNDDDRPTSSHKAATTAALPPTSPNRKSVVDAANDKSTGASSPLKAPIRKRLSKSNNGGSDAGSINNGSGRSIPFDEQQSTSTSYSDRLWNVIWSELEPALIDPADVHALLKECMSTTINKLSSCQIALMQRRVRSVVASLPRSDRLQPSKTISRILTSSSISSRDKHHHHGAGTGDESSRGWIDKHHQMDEAVLRKIFESGEALVQHQHGAGGIDILASAFLLSSHLSSQPLWDKTAAIAVETAEGLVRDVNKQIVATGKKRTEIPSPPPSSREQEDGGGAAVVEGVLGVNMSALCFLVGLALRGSKQQRLQLLFYLLLPPDVLSAFLASHPAGGLPTWLLEVGLDPQQIISLASLSHYYYFGTAFWPATASKREFPVSYKQRPAPLTLESHAVLEVIGNLLGTTTVPAASERLDSPERTASSHNKRASRRLSNEQSKPLELDKSQTEVMQYLADVRDGKEASYAPCPGLKHFEKASQMVMSGQTGNEWTMADFSRWANSALSDSDLDNIMHKLFGTGILPSPLTERELVVQEWQLWQMNEIRLWTEDANASEADVFDYLRTPYHTVDRSSSHYNRVPVIPSRVWGGVGGFDGRGGLGYGVMYVVDKKWWDAWTAYVGWSWSGNVEKEPTSRQRPMDLSTESVLDRVSTEVVPGTLGSYEVMKKDLFRGMEYVLIPSGVWDVLYELYGGGPPLPRMVMPPQRLIETKRDRSFSTDSKTMEIEDEISMGGTEVEVIHGKKTTQKLVKVPPGFGVVTHPWILHCHLCDASQPYRRGDAGPMSIRLMATPDQPLWRLYSEIIVRLQVQNTRAMGANDRGRARLWRRVDTGGVKEPISRYGPWSLLCKSRSAILPLVNVDLEFEDNFEELKDDWHGYTDRATVEGIGLANGDRIMLEYSVVNKDGDFTWPREAAAKAGHARRLADEDAKFRNKLRGIDDEGNAIKPPPSLTGMVVDAMDASGRWYQVEISKTQLVSESDDKTDDEDESEAGRESLPASPVRKASTSERREVSIDFSPFGGHSEWIEVDSDRLAVPGRFTLGTSEDGASVQTSSTQGDAKAKTAAAGKKANSNETSDQVNSKVCTLPGYGACGLSNLGNTCYANSAIQCISYLPLLRSYLLSAQYKANGDLNKDNPLGTGGKLLEEFAELIRVMWSGKYGERSPTRFRSLLGKHRSQFSAADQQDAQEFLNYMLDVLHEDSNRVIKKPYVEALEDDWVKQNSLLRVGDESWRRFLRRNQSVMADIVMGQVLNTVTCPKCHFKSPNFDPFNLLSLPFPTVADVVFQCTVVRRATVVNSPKILNRARKGDRRRHRFDLKHLSSSPSPPSEQFVAEQYVVAMSRLADIGDLRLRLQNLCGIPAARLRLCKVDELVIDKEQDRTSPVKTYSRVSVLPDKEGPCIHLAKTATSTDEVGTAPAAPTQILAFETTINPRPQTQSQKKGTYAPDDEDTSTDDEDEEDMDETESAARIQREMRQARDLLAVYGNSKECRVYDTDPLLISKAVSRSIWPRSEEDFKLGLRVDAIDHKSHWFPGSVVEIIAGVPGEDGDPSHSVDDAITKVKIHFDNFSSKWDEIYTIEHFAKGQVRPLYSHAIPRMRPTEFMVYHRYTDQKAQSNHLFGQPFYLQCQNEWTTARAGAHLLAQASRFLPQSNVGPVDIDDVDEHDHGSRANRYYDKCQSAISELIDILLEADRAYIFESLGTSPGDDRTVYRNPHFDASPMVFALAKKVNSLLNRLPFEVRVCTSEALVGGKGVPDDGTFPFSLIRSIGNFMNARHAVVLQWRDPPVERKSNGRMVSSIGAPVMYKMPRVAVHKSSALLEEDSKRSKNSPGSGGLHLGVCLTEFCKVNQLNLNDNWRCPRCKDYREGKQTMALWRLPDLLTFHIKRFNCSARWREKITTKVNFPLTGLDVSEWCHPESPAMHDGPDTHVYDLIGVLNHYGGMTGGHYVATCKATACGSDGSEEVSHNFNGASAVSDEEAAMDSSSHSVPSGWRLGRKEKESKDQHKQVAATASRNAGESAEPLWLQFDDELVEPIPPRAVVSEMAYVLFYRRRRMTPSNIAKYSTLE